MSKSKKNNKKSPKSVLSQGEVVPTSLKPKMLIIPDRALVMLKYREIQSVLNNVGVKFASLTLRNSVTLPNPATANNIPGQAAWANFYSTYRINRMRAVWKVSNQEAFAVSVYYVPVVGTPAANAANFSPFAAANPRGRSIELGPLTGKSTGVLRTPWFSLVEITGFIGSLFDISYTAAYPGGVPTNMFSVVLGINSNANNLVAGVNYELTLELETELFDRIFLIA